MMFGTGSNAELTRKYERVKVQNDIRTSKHIYKLVVHSNSANAWRASRLLLQKNRTEITSN